MTNFTKQEELFFDSVAAHLRGTLKEGETLTEEKAVAAMREVLANQKRLVERMQNDPAMVEAVAKPIAETLWERFQESGNVVWKKLEFSNSDEVREDLTIGDYVAIVRHWPGKTIIKITIKNIHSGAEIIHKDDLTDLEAAKEWAGRKLLAKRLSFRG